MAVFCPNNGNTYGSLQLWMDAVRDVDLGSPAVAIVKDSESFNQRLNIVGQWPKGLKIIADNAFNGVYDTQAVTTLTFQGDESIVFSIASGTTLDRKPIELTGFIFRHRGEGPRLTDNILNLDLNIHENFFEAIGDEYDTEWVGSSNIDIITHEETVDITIDSNVCYGAAREGIKVYNTLPNNALSNVHVNNNIVYNASSERDGFSGIKVFGGCRVDLNNNISITKYKQTSKGYEYVDASVLTKAGNATDSTQEDIEITNEDDLFVAKDLKNFQVKSDSPYLIANPNLGSFVQTVIGKGRSYPAEITFTDFNLINTTHVTGKLNTYNVNLIIGGEGEVEGYTRQASFMDGDVILADHGNLEFDQLARAFHESTGHNHDGTLSGGSLVPKIGDQESGNILEIDNLGVKGSVVSNDISMAANSDRLIVTQQASKGYTDFKTSGPELINTVNTTSDINFIDDVNLAKLANLPSVGSGYVPENPQDGLVYVRQDANWIEFPQISWGSISNKPYTVAGYGITDALTISDTAANSAKLGGQFPSYYTNIVGRLGYQPVEQGGGTGQGSQKINIGWLGSTLGLQVGATNYGSEWPIKANDASSIGGVDASEVYSSTNPPPPGTSLPRITKGSLNLIDLDAGYFLEGGDHSITINDGYGNFNLNVGAYTDAGKGKFSDSGNAAIRTTYNHEGTVNPSIITYFSSKTTDSVANEEIVWDKTYEMNKNFFLAPTIKSGLVEIDSPDYNDHLKLKRSSQGWSLSPNTNGSLDLSKVTGTGTGIFDVKAQIHEEGNRVYSPLNKPTPSDLGALSTSGTAANSLLLGGAPANPSSVASSIVKRDSSADINVRLVRSGYPSQDSMEDGASLAFRNNNTTDNYTRYINKPQAVADWMDVGTRTTLQSYVANHTTDLEISRDVQGSSPTIQTWRANGGSISIASGFKTGDVVTICTTNINTGGLYLKNKDLTYAYLPSGTQLKAGLDELFINKECVIRIYFYNDNACMISIY